jgi:hypothetical protein
VVGREIRANCPWICFDTESSVKRSKNLFLEARIEDCGLFESLEDQADVLLNVPQ